MKVAFATDDLASVNAHFAKARHLAIYEVTPDGWTHAQTVTFDDHDSADRVTPRLAALSDCALLFLKGIGGTAAAKVVKARVHPVALQQDEPMSEVLQRLRGLLESGPPRWLRQRMEAEPSAADNAGA